MEMRAISVLWIVTIILTSFILAAESSSRYAPLSGGGHEEFCYTRDECGPSSAKWDGSCKTGKRQSPIDISTKGGPGSDLQSPVHAKGDYLKPMDFLMMDTGHTASVMKNTDLSSRGTIEFSIGSGSKGSKGRLLPQATYTFSSLHFHWGGDSAVGSEHTLNGRKFSMEAHFVHYNSKYENFSAAIEQPDGLAVFGVFFQESPDENQALKPLVRLLDKVHDSGSKVNGKGLILKDLMPIMSKKPQNAYHYNGSLTTPKCFETVSWIVFESPLAISKSQLELFRSLVDSNGDKMQNNYRPTQPLNGREILPISVFCEKDCEELGTGVKSNKGNANFKVENQLCFFIMMTMSNLFLNLQVTKSTF